MRLKKNKANFLTVKRLLSIRAAIPYDTLETYAVSALTELIRSYILNKTK